MVGPLLTLNHIVGVLFQEVKTYNLGHRKGETSRPQEPQGNGVCCSPCSTLWLTGGAWAAGEAESPIFPPVGRGRCSRYSAPASLASLYFSVSWDAKLFTSLFPDNPLPPALITHAIRYQKTRKFPKCGENCSDCKTPESVPLPLYVYL